MQTVANTLATLWFFEANACGSRTPSANWQQLSGGATYLFSNQVSDALFLRLNGSPPAGTFYAGWDAATIAAGNPVVDNHHPQGDLKKVSEGSVLGFAPWREPVHSTAYIQSRWP